MAGLLAPCCPACPAPAARLHERAEAVLVDRQALLGRHLQRQVDREAVGVVQLEGAVARQDTAGLLRRRDRLVEDGGALAERLEEGRLLGRGHRVDAHRVGVELGVLRAHGEDRRVDQLTHHRLVGAEQAHRPDRAADDAAQDVAAALVGRRDAVAHQHHGGAGVVGDDAQPHVGGRVGAVAGPGQLRGAVEDGAAGVDLVQVVDALQDGGDPLQAHAGVDVLRRQRAGDVEVDLRAHRRQLVLHEDEVPQLEVAVLVGDRPALAAVLRPAVVVDLAARAAGARDAHVPVVVGLVAALDARLGDVALPELDRLVVVEVGRRPEPVLGQAVAAVLDRAGQQRPGEVDRRFLEVVAEAEVAGHLEEGAVPRGLADLVDVERAHALLHAGRPLVRRLQLAQEVRLERHHAGVDQQQRRVVGDQRRRGHDGVAAGLEVAEEAAADLVGPHGR